MLKVGMRERERERERERLCVRVDEIQMYKFVCKFDTVR
jgi:hypothetical protein